LPQGEPDIAVFTSGKPDFAISRLMQGFGLSAR
jgi:glutamate racemase